MKHSLALCFCGLLLFAPLCATRSTPARQKLTNQDVIKMVQAKLSTDIIVQTINSNENNFDLSPGGLVALKREGVSDSIIQAMMNRGRTASPPPPGSTVSVGDLTSSTRAVMLIDRSSRITLKYSTAEQRSSRALLGNPLSAKLYAALKGDQAKLRITNSSPEFEVPIPSDANPSDAVMIVRFDVKSDRREVQTEKMGMGGIKSGIPDKKRIPIKIDEARAQNRGASEYYRLFNVKPLNPLSSGEYAIVLSGQTMFFYDFGIDASQ